MRLIDADKINPSDVIGGNNEFASDIRKAMQDLIDSQPTAYDVDKVIEKIRNIPHGAILNVALEEEIIEIVKSNYDADDKHNNGWIPCSERLPVKDDFI